MSDTCIVCLGDLSNGNGDGSAISTTLAKSPQPDDANPVSETTEVDATTPAESGEKNSNELIAHIKPCGHYLHNECLTPWVERANSCPICRASFNLVELTDRVGGAVISSYSVEDRTQVADLDPSMFLEVPEEDDEDQPCQACGEDDNEDVLMYCDGCQKLWHTYCVGVQEVPYGHWFCDNCSSQREVDPRQWAHLRRARSSRRRTRGQQRRQRSQQHAHESSWNQVWQSVWSRINLDLDFPYEDDETSAAYIRRHRQRIQANRQAHDAWLRRMQVAELHGAGSRFRETEPPLPSSPGGISTPVTRNLRSSPLPQTESADEMMAWHAFDQARAMSNDAPVPPRKKKRKSRTSSPVESETELAPPTIKRRKIGSSTATEHGAPSGASSSRPRAPSASRFQSPVPRRPPPGETAAPSFLQSLLQEVEESSGNSPHALHLHRPSPRMVGSPPAEQQSPRPSSPALSPLPSTHSSPRAMSATPPPAGALRPGSPTGLSSSIQPVFPSTEYSPLRSGSPEPSSTRSGDGLPRATNAPRALPSSAPLAQPKPGNRVPRILEHTSSSPNRVRSTDASPTRVAMSLSAKSDVQKLVSAALKPHYNDQTITKDEYTAINRDISRMLYDKIGDFDTLDVDDKAKWEKVAGEEVNKAVGALRAQA